MSTTTSIKHFTDLHAWQIAHEFVLSVYKITKKFPEDERYGLVSQMRRAAVSITSNIAEGFGRTKKHDKQHFYVFAKSSLAELQSQLLVARDLKYVKVDLFDDLYDKSKHSDILLKKMIKNAKSKPDLPAN